MAPRGPLPKPTRRRRNAPTIPTTLLPISGFAGPIPRIPKWISLQSKGNAWWRWAWRTPQAAAWGPGDVAIVARRASLEDDLQVLEDVETIDLVELLDLEDESDVLRSLDFIIRRLHALAVGRLAVAKECRELDDRLGLTPKAFAQLRWQIVDDAAAKNDEAEKKPTSKYAHLRAVK